MLCSALLATDPLHFQMTHNQDWEVEKYSTPHEPKHHWQLKKKFMEHHKDRFPESELVSAVLSR